MTLLFLYGPPAVGKLTVARGLSEATGFPLADNHAIVNPIARVFGWDHPERVRLASRFRLELFQTAAKEGISLITTFGGGGAYYDAFVQETKKIVEAEGGEVNFVRLTAPTDVLLQRVVGASRSTHEKMNTPESLETFIDERPDVLARALVGEHLEINSDEHSPEEMVRMITEYYHLPTNSPSATI